MAEGGRSRARQSVADMIRSMALVVGVVGIAVFAGASLGRDPVLNVDYASDLVSARASAPYDILAPEGYDGLRATSVSYSTEGETTTWHLGFATDDERYIGLDQSDGASATFVADLTEGADAEAQSVEIDGESWTQYAGGGDEQNIHGLAREADGVTVLVSGTADLDDLERFAASLRAD